MKKARCKKEEGKVGEGAKEERRKGVEKGEEV